MNNAHEHRKPKHRSTQKRFFVETRTQKFFKMPKKMWRYNTKWTRVQNKHKKPKNCSIFLFLATVYLQKPCCWFLLLAGYLILILVVYDLILEILLLVIGNCKLIVTLVELLPLAVVRFALDRSVRNSLCQNFRCSFSGMRDVESNSRMLVLENVNKSGCLNHRKSNS